MTIRISTICFEDFRDRGWLALESSSSDGNRLYLPEYGGTVYSVMVEAQHARLQQSLRSPARVDRETATATFT
ncbi:hypothetical protein CYMTET_31982 [Cymbomonas tetramitiformis]|uniref:Uncharacterized protein n=1 Tax=Cymbomonas tetramitiformis TaxID=36881 RepID=A0AAE0FFX1_9CHLO|nr:hypothetical protein CYMTET_31982 [Cymbomonas tetramitiformis]